MNLDTTHVARELDRHAITETSAEQSGLTVVIPVFNEEEAIEGTLHRVINVLREFGWQYEVIVVNDGSTDRTASLLRHALARGDVRIIEHPSNTGYGAALKTGVRYARFPWIAIVDADGTYPLEQLPHLGKFIRDADMVVGARFGAQTQPRGVRGIARNLLRGFAQWLTHRKIPDLNSGLRIFRRDVAERFLRILPDGFSFTSTITLAMLTQGYRVHFEPIRYYQRIGRSKIRPVRDTFNFFRLIVRTSIYFAPLRVFMPVAMVFFTVFLAMLSWDVFVSRNLTEHTLIFLTAATQLGFFALLADMIDKRCG
ncbi:MAG: glycosyltransferase family 2 protein [Planctomycetota bacterium]|nr:glycosyltransferase family 2 protein [Planctomycetota bacterium]